jgi:hypothetical protein
MGSGGLGLGHWGVRAAAKQPSRGGRVPRRRTAQRAVGCLNGTGRVAPQARSTTNPQQLGRSGLGGALPAQRRRGAGAVPRSSAVGRRGNEVGRMAPVRPGVRGCG